MPAIYDRVHRDLMARIQQGSGAAALSCGDMFDTPAERRERTAGEIQQAIPCGKRALAAGEPFWFAVGGFALDSWVAEGLLAGPGGDLQRFSYDSDPGGGGGLGASANFTIGRCVGARLHQYSSGGLVIECLNDPWKLVVHAVVLGIGLGCGAVALGLTRWRWAKTARVLLALAVGFIALVVWALGLVGGLRDELVISASLSGLVACGLLVYVHRRSTSLAA